MRAPRRRRLRRHGARGTFGGGVRNRTTAPAVLLDAKARAHGVVGHTITRIGDFAPALEAAIASDKPAVLDVHVDAEVRPPATGAWALPPLPHKEPVFGRRLRAADIAATAAR
jgi:TPP-dependent trihydroxycyclohexane-1,2-dione (THcHDO) dehydratase